MAATDSHHRFVLAVHRATAAAGGDACFSPYSVASALTLAARGARGPAFDELRALLGPDLDAHADLLRRAATLPEDQATLAVTNTLWAWDELPLEDGFKTELAGWPGASIESAPFVRDPERVRELINADVARTTQGLIPELLDAGAIADDAVASLVNALYLKAGWTHAFPERATADADFHAPSGNRPVPTMHLEEKLGHAHVDGWQVVQLPAAGGVHALILLPDGDLAEAEAKLDERRLTALLEAPRARRVRLALPKISLDVRSPLTEVLQGLGVRTMFTRDADFAGLSPDPRLYVSRVLHQAVLRFDEKGLEGAAATAVTFRAMAMSVGEPLPVTVDRPFLLAVRHAGTGAVYFFARVVEP